MADRPAAELLAEWKAISLPYAAVDEILPLWKRFAVAHLDGVLVRLARAEQSLAAAQIYADYWRLPELRAILRAAQGDQT